MISGCHSRPPSVIPDVSQAVIPAPPSVIPDVIHRESKAEVKGAGGTRRSPTLLRRLHHGAKKKDHGFPLTDGGNDREGAGVTGEERECQGGSGNDKFGSLSPCGRGPG